MGSISQDLLLSSLLSLSLNPTVTMLFLPRLTLLLFIAFLDLCCLTQVKAENLPDCKSLDCKDKQGVFDCDNGIDENKCSMTCGPGGTKYLDCYYDPDLTQVKAENLPDCEFVLAHCFRFQPKQSFTCHNDIVFKCTIDCNMKTIHFDCHDLDGSVNNWAHKTDRNELLE